MTSSDGPAGTTTRRQRRNGAQETASEGAAHGQLGTRLREARVAANLGVRELARQLDLSASLISQIELGRVVPSVSTLYALTNTLGVSMDSLFAGGDLAPPSETSRPIGGLRPPAVPEREPSPGESAYIQRATQRRAIELEQGVRWELLTPSPEPGAEFLEVTYPVGGSSSPNDHAIRHSGRDYCLILQGELSVQIGFEEHLVGPGDSLAFDGTIPHRFWNVGSVPVHAVWFVLDRSATR